MLYDRLNKTRAMIGNISKPPGRNVNNKWLTVHKIHAIINIVIWYPILSIKIPTIGQTIDGIK